MSTYHAHESRDARALNLKDIVERTDAEVMAGEGERHIWEPGTLVAFDSVLTIVALLGSDLLVAANL